MKQYEVILYYKYVHVADPLALVIWHKDVCVRLGLKGRVLVAYEGINGTLEGEKSQIDEYCKMFTSQIVKERFADFSDVSFKRSTGSGKSFKKLVIKEREEIVSAHLGDDDVDPNKLTGKHLPAEDLKRWYENGKAGKDFHIIDMRNTYEYKVGHFDGSVDAGMRNFRDLSKVVPNLEHLKDKKVLTVCTGGVRCEKASGFLMKKGFKDVYQLDGGMATYMEKFPGKDFLGALYVFDDRITTETTKDRVIIGICAFCNATSERYVNCLNDECHLHYICCEECEKERLGDVHCPDCSVSSPQLVGLTK